MQISITPPKFAVEAPGRDTKSVAKSRLQSALEGKLAPVDYSKSDPARITGFYLSPRILGPLQKIAEHENLALTDVVCGLITAAARREKAAQPTGAQKQTESPRDLLQKRLFGPLKKTIEMGGGGIAIAEGGTGLGKTRIAISAALHGLSKNYKKVAIAVPTVNLLSHMLREAKMVSPDIDPTSIVPVIGSGHFICPDQLRLVLEEPHPETEKESWEAAKAWCEKGGPPITRDTMELANFAPETIRWMKVDLEAAAPGFPASLAVDHSQSPEAYARTAAARLRIDAAGDPKCKIMLVTHTMLCLDVVARLRKTNPAPLLPNYDLLIIDEAHLLDESMANVTGQSVSTRMIRAMCKEISHGAKPARKKRAETALNAINHLDDKLRDLKKDSILSPSANAWKNALPYVTLAANALAAITAKETPNGEMSRFHGRMKEWVRCLNRCASGKEIVRLQLSPVIAAPSLTVGPSYLKNQFDALWEQPKATVLLSGTLYIVDQHGTPSVTHTTLRLWIPPEKAIPITPVHPDWLLNTPTFHAPNIPSGKAQRLIFPGNDHEENSPPPEYDEWITAVAHEVIAIAKRAKGGTLILAPGYTDIKGVSAKIQEHPEMTGRLLTQSRNQTFAIQERAFRKLHSHGLRPVWLATGPAWTGLDLTLECPPEEDDLLTDLAILRIPYNLDRSAPQLARKQYLGFASEISATIIRIRQGLGRLIRREGVSDRHIWWLDGRPYATAKHGAVRTLLDQYPKQETF